MTSCSSLLSPPSIRAIVGQCWTQQAGVSQLCGGGRLRHAGRHRLRQKHCPHQGAPRLFITSFVLSQCLNVTPPACFPFYSTTSNNVLSTYSRNFSVCLIWPAKTRGFSARNTRSTSGEDTVFDHRLYKEWTSQS